MQRSSQHLSGGKLDGLLWSCLTLRGPGLPNGGLHPVRMPEPDYLWGDSQPRITCEYHAREWFVEILQYLLLPAVYLQADLHHRIIPADYPLQTSHTLDLCRDLLLQLSLPSVIFV